MEAKKCTKNNSNNNVARKVQDIVSLIGHNAPSDILIKPPKISKNKGTGVHMAHGVSSIGSGKRLNSD